MRQQEIKGGTGVSEYYIFEKDFYPLQVINFLVVNLE